MKEQTYVDMISEYTDNCDTAISNIDSLKTNLDTLHNSFANASGSDITKIEEDIEDIKRRINDFRTLIVSKKNKAVTNATTCNACYIKWKNKMGKYTVTYEPMEGHSTPQGSVFKKITESVTHVSINSSGMIYVEKKQHILVRKVYDSTSIFFGGRSTPVNAKSLFGASSSLFNYTESSYSNSKSFTVNPVTGFEFEVYGPPQS